MGCYAAVSALELAHHLVRSDPAARVLVVTVELCTLHLQPDTEIEPILAMLLFGDGASAALVTAEPTGFTLSAPFAAAIPDSREMIGWTIGDKGFAMHLSGAVPVRIGQALADPALLARIGDTGDVDTYGGPCRRSLGARRGGTGARRWAPTRCGHRARFLRDLRQHELCDADVRAQAHAAIGPAGRERACHRVRAWARRRGFRFSRAA